MSRRAVALAWPALTGITREGAFVNTASAVTAAQILGGVRLLTLEALPFREVKPFVPQLDACCRATAPQSPGPSPRIPNGKGSLNLHSRLTSAALNPATAAWLPGPLSRGYSSSAAAGTEGGEGGRSSAGTVPGSAGSPGPGSGSPMGENRMTLGEALNQLVDAAIEKVEAGQMEDAVSLLKDGLSTFEPVFPNSPELGELHNQTALLLLFQGRADEAAHHAQASLETTKRHFGPRSQLTTHRLLRLGVCRFAQRKMADAAGLLREAFGLLDASGAASGDSSGGADPGSRSEAGFYLDCVALAHVRDAGGVEALSTSLRGNVRGMKDAYGAESMILSLAMAQHSRLVNGGLEQADFLVGEALLKQQISLLGEVSGPDSEDVAVARYKLATYYYANDMLADAGAAVRQAAVALRVHYPDEHDLLVLCKHRLGMICAAQGDHRSAKQLLQASRQHFAGEGGQGMLAKEADIGLAMAKFRAVDAAHESPARRVLLQQEALELVRTEVETLAQAIGHGHMLVQGATRYYGQLAKLAR